MFKAKYVLLSLAAALVCWQVAGVDTVNSGIVDAGNSSVRSGHLPALVVPAPGGGAADCIEAFPDQEGVVSACPLGDGDPLTAAVGGTDCQITLIVKDNACTPIEGIPATDMWLVGCNDGLLLCGGSQGSMADHATGNGNDYPKGMTTFSNEPIAGGCDTGLYAIVQAIVLQGGTGSSKCLPIHVRSMDYKSAGAPGPAPCAADIRCPDGKVTNADFSWFVGHYTTAPPPKPYFACADYAAPLGSITLADFSKFAVHFAGAGHKCP